MKPIPFKESVPIVKHAKPSKAGLQSLKGILPRHREVHGGRDGLEIVLQTGGIGRWRQVVENCGHEQDENDIDPCDAKRLKYFKQLSIQYTGASTHATSGCCEHCLSAVGTMAVQAAQDNHD